MTLDAFTELAEEYAEAIPEALLEGLNGGILIEEEARRRDDDPPGVYLLGEYVTDEHLGALIVLYYGSFIALFGDEDDADDVIADELWETLRHELRHHIEARAGVRDLDKEDLEALEALWEEAMGHGRAGGGPGGDGAEEEEN